MAKDEYKYMVMKLLTQVEAGRQNVRLHGCAGYVPIYDTWEEAKKMAGKKYKIKIIATIKP